MDNSIRPGYHGPGRDHLPRSGTPSTQYGASDSETARLRSLINGLMSRVNKLESDIASIQGDIGTTISNNQSSPAQLVAPAATVATHYHSFLVYPGTVNPALQIDTDGGSIFQNIWKTFINSNDKYKHEQFDENLGVGSRSWKTWTDLPPSLG